MKKVWSTTLLVVLAVSCSKKDKKENTEEENSGTPSSSGTGGSATVGTLKFSEMNLADSINPPIPASVLSSSNTSATLRGLGLTTGGKSRERCMLQESVSEVKTNVAMVSSQLCMLEKTPGMQWGGKYNISFSGMGMRLQDMPPGGPGGDPGMDPGAGPGGEGGPGGDMPDGMPTSMQVFMDNSVAGKHSVYVCSDNTLQQVIHIDDAKAGAGAKGSYAINMDMGTIGAIQISGTFDNGIGTAGRYLGEARMRFKIGQMQASSIVKMDLGLAESDVSLVQSAKETATSFDDVSTSIRELIVGRIGPSHGMSLVQSNDTQFGSENASTPETAYSYFSTAGDVVASDASGDFAAGGALHVAPSDFIKLLPTDSYVALSGWDCSGTTDLDMSAAMGADSDMSSCYEGLSDADPTFSCYDGFASGESLDDAPVFTGEDNRFDEQSFSEDGLEIPVPE
jgi:hypothetical protein